MVGGVHRIKIRSPPLRRYKFLRVTSPALRTSQRLTMGVTIERLLPGDGANYPNRGDKVTIHYVGTLADGSQFDSSRDRNEPFQTQIGVGKVIRGWDEGVPQLSLGEKAILNVTPDYGYGARGFPPVIPPNSTLTFEVELLGINNLKSPTAP